MNKNIALVVLLVALAAGGGFFTGMKYQESKIPSFAGRFRNGGPNGSGGPNGGQNRFGGRPVTGEIINSDNKSITVKLQDGSSKIVLLSSNTSINKATQGSVADLTTGITAATFGIENSDGSITAQNIQINPLNRYTASPSASGK